MDGSGRMKDAFARGQCFRMWVRCFQSLDLTPPSATFLALLDAYSEPHRHYHTLEHLAECFTGLEGAWRQLEDPVAVAWALFFHDAVYDPRAGDNEVRSAGMAYHQGMACGLGEERARRAAWLVLLTQGHRLAMPVPDAEWVLDLDLGILGSDPARFERYQAQIRDEYAFVPEDIYRQERRRVLQTFLEEPTLFHTSWGQAREAQARANLAHAIRTL